MPASSLARFTALIALFSQLSSLLASWLLLVLARLLGWQFSLLSAAW